MNLWANLNSVNGDEFVLLNRCKFKKNYKNATIITGVIFRNYENIEKGHSISIKL